MKTNPSIPESGMGQPDAVLHGACVCGTPVIDHYRRNSRGRLERLSCDAARERHARRVDVDASHRHLLEVVLATVLLAQSGRVPGGTPIDSLTESERREVGHAAVAAISLLDSAKRRIARQRAYEAAIAAYTAGEIVSPRVRASLRQLLDDALTAHDNALQGVQPITDEDLGVMTYGELTAAGEVQ